MHNTVLFVSKKSATKKFVFSRIGNLKPTILLGFKLSNNVMYREKIATEIALK